VKPRPGSSLIAVIPAGTTPSGIGYAQANELGMSSYTPDPSYSYSSSGEPITAARSAVGQYNGGNVLVSLVT
jgi:hypothetical protein